MASNTYDELGRMKTKSLHGSATNKLTYSYNIRDWLTGISGSKLTQNLYYNTGSGTAQYGGNISSMTWKAGNESVIRGDKFSYDNLNRLTTATYGEGTSISGNANRFTEKVTGYDKNGNITGLQRYGQTSSSAYGLIDNLTYTLSGNQVTRVDDATTATAYNNGFEFKDAVKQANEYAYDKNGNLTKDLNRNITSIQYNCLNLPSKVTFGNGNTITYLYAADGTKLRTVHKTGSTTTTTDYCGNVVYENGTQKLLLTEEGYVTLADSKYHYYLKDHQGNNRVVISSTGTVEETNHYYPFGGVFAAANNVQPYKYNGKEFDNKNGLNWYDYGARHYDAALGRWHAVDPMAEKYCTFTPYSYCVNNPICNVDLDGADWYIYHETGELYFNRNLNSRTISFNDRTYERIGNNNMLGDMKDIIEQSYDYQASQLKARQNGYSINPVQQISSEISREQPYSTGKNKTTVTTGETEIVNEMYDVFSLSKTQKINTRTDVLANPENSPLNYFDYFVTGGKRTDKVVRNYYTYSSPTLGNKLMRVMKNIYGIMEPVLTGKQDYRNVIEYKSWEKYSTATNNNGRLLKYKK